MKKLGERYKLIILGAALLSVVMNFKDALNATAKVIGAFSPVFIGILFALILNIPLNFYERKLFVFQKSKLKKHKRTIGLIATYATFLIVVGGLFVIVLPHLIRSLTALGEHIPGYIGVIPEKIQELAQKLGIPDEAVKSILASVQKYSEVLYEKLIGYLPKVLEFSKNIFKGLYNFLMGLALSIFILGRKEKLVFQFKRILTAVFGQHTANNIFNVVLMANKKLSRFLAGQTFECLLVGAACFVFMLIFKIPYAALVSLIIGLTNFIPMVGPLIGLIPSTLIIMLDSPIKALYFVIIENVIQQLESTFIYPKVVGGKLGLSGVWVFASVLVLGNLFGFIGMFLGVPLFACLYAVIGEAVKTRLAKSEIRLAEFPIDEA
ncbi:MAG: AI-2E family transporter [Clostridiales bacterium]|jgi:predicted PurR-regulated permease PerM|nr:AI-2E family transporter [Clostridiales bacterium]